MKMTKQNFNNFSLPLTLKSLEASSGLEVTSLQECEKERERVIFLFFLFILYCFK